MTAVLCPKGESRARTFCVITLAAVSGSPSHAQQASAPATTATVGHDTIFPSSFLQSGPFEVSLDASLGMVYDDNITIQNSGQQRDLVWTLAPVLLISTGDGAQREESWAALTYAPRFNAFTDHTEDDSIDQSARVEGEWRPASWTLGLSQDFKELSGPVVEVGGRVHRDIYTTHAYAQYDYSPRTSFEVDGDYSRADYGSDLLGFSQYSASAWMKYWLTPKVRLDLGATGGILEADQNSRQTFVQGLVRAEYDMMADVSFNGSAGIERRSFDSARSDRTNFVFSLRGNWKPSDSTELSTEIFRKDESSLVAVAQNYTLTGAQLNFRQDLFSRYSVNVAAGFDDSHYYSTSITPRGVRSDFDFFFVRPGVTVQVTPQLTAEVFYQYENNQFSVASGFVDRQIGLAVTYQF